MQSRVGQAKNGRKQILRDAQDDNQKSKGEDNSNSKNNSNSNSNGNGNGNTAILRGAQDEGSDFLAVVGDSEGVSYYRLKL